LQLGDGNTRGRGLSIQAIAVILVASPPFIGDRRRIADLAVTHRLPMLVGAKEYAEAGGLLGYATDSPDQ